MPINSIYLAIAVKSIYWAFCISMLNQISNYQCNAKLIQHVVMINIHRVIVPTLVEDQCWCIDDNPCVKKLRRGHREFSKRATLYAHQRPACKYQHKDNVQHNIASVSLTVATINWTLPSSCIPLPNLIFRYCDRQTAGFITRQSISADIPRPSSPLIFKLEDQQVHFNRLSRAPFVHYDYFFKC